MGRRTSSGRIGAPTFGGLLASNNTTITTDDDSDIILDPTGTGRVLIEGNTQLQAQSELRFADSDSSNYVGLAAPTTVASDVTWTLPNADGSSGQVIQTDGNGVLSFTDAGVGLTDDTTDSDTAYIVLSNSTSGTQTGFEVSSTKLSFVASTGTLSATEFSGGGGGLTGVVAATLDTSSDFQMNSLGVGTAGSGTTGEIRATNQITSYYSSDINLKENVKNIDNALDLVSKINGVRYDWTDEYIESRGGEDGYFVRKSDIGVIAQEVEAVFPEIVAENSQGHLSVRYEKLVAVLIEAVKELKNQIESVGGEA